MWRFPADRRHAALLASRYRSEFLGEIRLDNSDGRTLFDFGGWKAPVASRASPDRIIDFVVVTPSAPLPFVAGSSGGRRTLTIRDAQNEYVFAETD